VPSLVNRDRILEANSKLALSTATAEAIGPALSGSLIQLLTAPLAMAIDAASFLVSATSLLFIRKPETIKAPVAHIPSFHELTAGFRFVFSHRILRPIALRAATNAFFGGFFSALYVLYAIDNLKFTPFLLGIIVTLGGISNFIGTSLLPWFTRRFEPGFILIAATIVQGTATLFIPLAPGPGLAGIFCMGCQQFLGDISFPVYNVEELTIRQLLAPDHMLGRVNATMQLLFRGILPIGALVGGSVAQYAGVRRTLLLCSIGVLLSSLWLIFSPVRTLKRHEMENLVN
jgi:predicted MFS family arabinose efflux permease